MKTNMAAQYKLGQLFHKFHLQKQLQAQPEVNNLTDISSQDKVSEDVPEMRPESPESEDEKVEVPSPVFVNLTSKPTMSSKQKTPHTKSSATKKSKKFSWVAEKAGNHLNYIIREYKSACEFRGIDLEAVLVAMHMR